MSASSSMTTATRPAPWVSVVGEAPVDMVISHRPISRGRTSWNGYQGAPDDLARVERGSVEEEARTRSGSREPHLVVVLGVDALRDGAGGALKPFGEPPAQPQHLVVVGTHVVGADRA